MAIIPENLNEELFELRDQTVEQNINLSQLTLMVTDAKKLLNELSLESSKLTAINDKLEQIAEKVSKISENNHNLFNNIQTIKDQIQPKTEN
jgi:prophage DNA circulation protein